MCALHKHLHRENILYCSKRFHSRGLTGKQCTVNMTVGEAHPDREILTSGNERDARSQPQLRSLSNTPEK